LLLRVNFYTVQKIDLVFEIIENRLENQLDDVARSPQYALLNVLTIGYCSLGTDAARILYGGGR